MIFHHFIRIICFFFLNSLCGGIPPLGIYGNWVGVKPLKYSLKFRYSQWCFQKTIIATCCFLIFSSMILLQMSCSYRGQKYSRHKNKVTHTSYKESQRNQNLGRKLELKATSDISYLFLFIQEGSSAYRFSVYLHISLIYI